MTTPPAIRITPNRLHSRDYSYPDASPQSSASVVVARFWPPVRPFRGSSFSLASPIQPLILNIPHTMFLLCLVAFLLNRTFFTAFLLYTISLIREVENPFRSGILI